ncbi:MAG: LemA family protein [bacterium]
MFSPLFFFVIIGGVGVWLMTSYNGLVTLKNRCEEALADINVQLKRRYDLIPNLVETVKGYATHEKEVFEKVTEARTRAMAAQTGSERQEAENALSSTLKSLFAVAENYPQLKAAENFLELQRELTDTEDKIQASRRFYNTNVRDMNIMIETFPSSVVASMFKFTQREFFEIAEGEKEPVKVKF